MNRYCSPMCRICRTPGRMCAASARAEEEERHGEDTDLSHDALRARSWSSQPRTELAMGWYDTRDPWPHDSHGRLYADPAHDFS